MKKTILIIACMMIYGIVLPQAPDWTWAQSAGTFGLEYGYHVACDEGGHVFVAGNFSSDEIDFGDVHFTGNSTNEVFIVKYDQTGTVIWAHAASGTSDDFCYGVTTDSEGNCYITGIFMSESITFDTFSLTNTGGSDVFVVKYDAVGNVVWAKSGGGMMDEYAYSIAVTSDHQVFVCGTMYSDEAQFGNETVVNSASGYWESFILKLDTDGTYLWARGAEGNVDDYAFGLDVDENGNCYVTGHFWSESLDFGDFEVTNHNAIDFSDAYVVKYNSEGLAVWARAIGGTGSDLGRDIAVDNEGNCVVSGYYSSSTIDLGLSLLTNLGSADLFLIKYNQDGDLVWARTNGEIDYDKANAIAVDAEGNAYVTGFFTGFTLPLGNTTLTSSTPGEDKLFVVKYDVNGDIVWATSAANPDIADGLGIAVDTGGNCYVSGTFTSTTMTFDGITITNGGANDMFIAKLGSAVIGITENPKTNAFSIVPNPMLDIATIAFQHPQNGTTLRVTDLTGKVMKESLVTGTRYVFTRNELAPGMYIVQIISENNEIAQQKMILE